MWQTVVVLNVLIASCYVLIATVILRGLIGTRQLWRNPLGLATALIFISCALHHAGQAVHLALPLGHDAHHVTTVREAFGEWHFIVIDVFGILVALTYLALRRSYKALLRGPGMFSDLAEQRYRQLAANMPHTSVIMLDRDFRYVLAEGLAVSDDGYASGARVGERAPEVLEPEVWAALEPHYLAALAGEASELDMPGSAEGVVFHLRVAPMWDEDGHQVESILVLAEDETDKRRAEAALREVQVFNEAVLAASPDVMTVTDVATETVVWASRDLAAVFAPGLSVDAPVGPLRFTDFVTADDLPELRAATEHLGTLADGESVTTRFRLASPDGTTRWIACRTTPFRRDQHGTVRRALSVMRDVSAIVEAEQQLRHAALHDPLTGLPNRSLLVELLATAIERRGSDAQRGEGDPEELVLLFCDVDGFKHVNDTYGHAAGDAVLVETARRLKGALREGDTVARVGGDEFVVLLTPGPGGTAEPATSAHSVAERLRRDVARPVGHDGAQLSVSLSVGMTTVRGSATPDDALRDADAAMYSAKLRGKNRVEVFDEALAIGAARRRSTEEALTSALDPHSSNGAALGVVFQPVYQVQPRRLVGFEALARLTGPDGTPIGPDEFIPVAEETGQINQLGELVLDQALRELARWQREHAVEERATMAVNVSARQAQHANLPQLVAAALSRHGLRPEDLVIEVTESVLLESGSSTLLQLSELHAMGVGIAIDDFGTGYASLQYLATLPFDTVKVDKSFTRGLPADHTSTAILKATVALAAELHKVCIIEGIETDEQLDSLPVGVLGQGYLLGRPNRELLDANGAALAVSALVP